jgi:hypothetical protein
MPLCTRLRLCAESLDRPKAGPAALLPTDIEFVRADLEGCTRGAGCVCERGHRRLRRRRPLYSDIYVRVWPIVMRNLLDAWRQGHALTTHGRAGASTVPVKSVGEDEARPRLRAAN